MILLTEGQFFNLMVPLMQTRDLKDCEERCKEEELEEKKRSLCYKARISFKQEKESFPSWYHSIKGKSWQWDNR